MRRVLASLMALGMLLLGAAGVAEEADTGPFWWDVHDTELATKSGGTGGSPEDRPAEEQRDIREYPITWVGPAEGWRREVYGHLPVEWEACQEVDGRLLCSYTLVDLPDGTPRLRAGCVDLRTDQPLTLSDLFYDGVNYIDYINREALRVLMGGTIHQEWKMENYWYQPGERHLRRPFSGFPRDYPYFAIGEEAQGRRLLGLFIDAENPLFRPDLFADHYQLWIPLPASLSPYGLPWAEVTGHWVTRDEPGVGNRVYLVQAIPSADLGEAQAERINGALEELAKLQEERFNDLLMYLAQSPDDEQHWVATGVRPNTRYAGQYLSVSYGERPLLAGAVFTLATGRVLDGLALAWHWGRDARTEWYRTGLGYGYGMVAEDALMETPDFGAMQYQGSQLRYQQTAEDNSRYEMVLQATFLELDDGELHLLLPLEVLETCEDCWLE